MRFSRRTIVIGALVGVLTAGLAVFFVFRENIFGWRRAKLETKEAPTLETTLSPESGAPAEEDREKTPAESPEKTAEEVQNPPALSPPVFPIFGKVSVAPDYFLDGAGSNVDSPEFFETDDYRQALLLVSGKGNNVVEVWKYPFRGNEQSPLKRSSVPNGLAVDQDRDWLLIGDSEKQEVAVYALPGLRHVKDIGRGKLEKGETNVDVLTRSDGGAVIYATENHGVRGFDAESGRETAAWSPRVESIEEVLVDDYHSVIYVPDEKGVESKLYPGGAVAAYTPQGQPFSRGGTNILARGVFSGDGEGAALYRCLDQSGQDTGRGWLIFVDQDGSRENGLEFFNRETWKHLGTLALSGVSFTDGLGSTQMSFPEYPQGILAVHNDNKNTAVVSWEKILAATKLACN